MTKNEVIQNNIAVILKNWNIENFELIEPEHGRDHFVVFVNTSSDNYVLKVYDSKFTDRVELSSRIIFQSFLQSKDISTPVYLKSTLEEEVCEIIFDEQSFLAVLMKKMEGVHPKFYNTRLVKDLGSEVAKMHLASLKYRVKPQKEVENQILTERYSKSINLKEIKDKDVLDFLQRAREFQFSNTILTKSYIHSDIGKNNILVSGDTIGFIDFDDLDYTYLVKDLAYTIVSIFNHTPDKKVASNLAELFLSSYESIRKLSLEERKSLKPLMLLRVYLVGAFLYKKGDGEGKVLEYIENEKFVETMNF